MKPLVPFTPWPVDLAAHYRAQGWWRGQPLTALLDDSAERYPERTALICGERTLSYGQLKREVDALAARLTVRGLGHGDTALVQLPNCAEFYICWFALIRCGVVAVHALYSHQRRELVGRAVGAIDHDPHAAEVEALGHRVLAGLDVAADGVASTHGLAEALRRHGAERLVERGFDAYVLKDGLTSTDLGLRRTG